MSVKYTNKSHSFYDLFSSFILIVIIFTSIYFVPCGALNSSKFLIRNNAVSTNSKSYSRLVKRDTDTPCLNTSECETEMRGSVCVQNKCMCPQGFLPTDKGVVCLRIRNIGSFCNASVQCGEGLYCRNHICQCPEQYLLFRSHGINICLVWMRSIKVIERCRNNEDCISHDENLVCRKKWCQCDTGFQMFETMLYGLKQKCFKTLHHRCHNASQCSKYAKTPDNFCMCEFGVCHCMLDMNLTALDVPNWSGRRPNWYQRWKKDLILATRLLFITVILFFVPCFIYVTLGVRERSRQLFSQFVQPSRIPNVHYTQRRPSNLRPLRSYRGLPLDLVPTLGSPNEAHNVEISLHANGINSRLIENPRSMSQVNCETRDQDSVIDMKEEDPPPSYDEIMRRDTYPEAPPPPYREL